MTVDEHTTQRLGDELLRMVKLLVSLRQHAPRPHPEVDYTHFPVLFNLAAQPRRVSDLAGCVHSDVSTVSRQVSHLVETGLVAKSPDPHDGRVHLLALTDTGREAIATITANRGRWFGRVLASWSEQDAATFLRLVSSFVSALEAAKSTLSDPANSPSLDPPHRPLAVDPANSPLAVDPPNRPLAVGRTSSVEAIPPLVQGAGKGSLVEQSSWRLSSTAASPHSS